MKRRNSSPNKWLGSERDGLCGGVGGGGTADGVANDRATWQELRDATFL